MTHIRSVLRYLVVAAVLAVAACQSAPSVTYSLDNSYYASLALWDAYDKTTLSPKVVGDVETANRAALRALDALNKAVCPQAYTVPVGDKCVPTSDAVVSVALATAQAAINAFNDVMIANGVQ